MLRSSHRFYIVLAVEGEAPLRGEVSTLSPMYEDLLFAAVRSGAWPNDGRPAPAELEPVWRNGAVAGFSASLAGISRVYSLDVFRHDAHQLLIRSGALRKGEGKSVTYEWHVEAEEAPSAPPRVRVRREPYPFQEGVLPGARPPAEEAGALRVFVGKEVLQQLRDETANSLGMERADILEGVLLRDGDEVAAVVKGRFPLAFETEASAAHVAFSPLTFAAARRDRLARDPGATLLGWHHNHPPKCGRDCLLTVPACENDSVFLSIDDYNVFSGGFAAAYLIGLISGKGKGRRADDPILRAYGWRNGVVQEVPFTVLTE